MTFLQEIKKWLSEITEIGLLLIALGVTFEILFGFEGIPFFGGIVGNITNLLKELGDNGLAGLIALGIILYLFYRSKLPVQQQK